MTTPTRYLSVKIIFYNSRNEWLFLHRNAAPDVLLDLPGGKVDANESIDLAAKRELFEETGLVCEKFAAIGGYVENVREKIILFIVVAAPIEHANILLSHEHAGFGWYMPETLPFSPLPYLLPAIKLGQSELPLQN